MSASKINFYTDGAASTKTECGGWACIAVDEQNEIIKTLQGREVATTNNRMELLGFYKCLLMIDEMRPKTAAVYCDSAYVVNCFTNQWYARWMVNGWKSSDKQPVKNQDLWKIILPLYLRLIKEVDIFIIKVKSHSDDKYNNYCDLLAVKERKALELLEGY